MAPPAAPSAAVASNTVEKSGARAKRTTAAVPRMVPAPIVETAPERPASRPQRPTVAALAP